MSGITTHPAAEHAETLLASFHNILTSYDSVHHGRSITPADAFFVYRLFLGRNPDPHHELPGLLVNDETYREFMSRVQNCEEFARVGGFFPPNRLFMAELPHFRFWFNTNDREMGVSMALGSYEPSTVALAKEIVRPGMHCLDVGAQTGFFTCLMSSLVGPVGKVWAFEPMPASFHLVEKNVRENHYETIVELYPRAASNAPATIEGTLVSNMYVVGHLDMGEPVTIEAVRIDDIVTAHVDVIKIDVEGHEPAAIEGMRGLIERDRPIIVSEVNEYWLRNGSGSSARQYLQLLTSLGYDVYDVEHRHTPLQADSINLEALDTMNVIAIPPAMKPKH
jgi:FkbM family methyltransferase